MPEPELRITFANLRSDNSSLVDDWEVLLRVVGDFEVSIGGEPIYREQEFCMVEFGVQAVEWSRQLYHRKFVYRTLESEELGLVYIKKRQAGWQIGSIYQTTEAPPLSVATIRAAIEAYWSNLRLAVERQFQRDISVLLNLQHE
jgi:hypothetical protein